MSNTTLLSLAFLKVNWDAKKQSYLDLFIPFVSESLQELPHDVVATPDLQVCILNKFGLKIPQQVIKRLLIRLARNGTIIQKDHLFYRNLEKLDSSGFESKQKTVLRFYSALIHDISLYISKKYLVNLSEQETENILFSFISYNQKRAFPRSLLRKIVR